MMVRRFREVIARADLAPGQRVLDLGCGWGYGTLWAHRLGCRTTGIDLGMDQLAWGARMPEGGALGFVQADAMRIPYRDATFDRAISVEMMEHVYRPHRTAVFAEIARVMKPGGRIAISTPNTDSPVEVVKRVVMKWPALRRRLPSACFPEAVDDPDTYHPYRYHHPLAIGELTTRLEDAGFRVLGSSTFLWLFKTSPDALLGAGQWTERVVERLPLLRRLGATTLVWAERR